MSSNFPGYGDDGVAVDVSDVSLASPMSTSALLPTAADVWVDNQGANDVFIRVGGPSVTANELCKRVPAGGAFIFAKGAFTHLAAVCKAGRTSKLVLHIAQGI